MNERELILNRVRKALDRIPKPPARLPAYMGPSLSLIEEEAELIRVFRKEAESQGVNVHQASRNEEVTTLLARILEDLIIKTVILWSDITREFPGILEALDRIGTRDLTPTLNRPEHVPLRKDFVKSASLADAGITGADFALADTGSLVLLTSQGKNRSTSLLPPVHLALLPSSRIIPHAQALFARLSEAPGAGPERESAVTLITGTSKTADIELTLVRGVHGPREVHVIIYPDTFPGGPKTGPLD